MTQSLVLVEETEPGIALVTLNRPEKRNALNIALLDELQSTIVRITSDPNLRALIITGAGPIFCAGLDLKEASEREHGEGSADLVANVLELIYSLPIITIAAVQGAALAGGAGLMTACDFVVAADDVKIGYPEVRRGMVAAIVSSLLLRQVGDRDARELLLLGDSIDAERARAVGLVHRVVAKGAVLDECLRIARTSLLGGPRAIARTKGILAEFWPITVTSAIEEARAGHVAARDSEEAQEGFAAFLEKRPPNWVSNLGKSKS